MDVRHDEERADEGHAVDLDFVTIHTGNLGEVQVLEALLRDSGFRAFVADRNTKVIDPFITGANPLAVRLQVPRVEAADALAVLREAQEEFSSQEGSASSTDPEAPTDLREDVERTARRVRWCAVLMPLGPVGFLLGLEYFFRSLELQPKPRGHWMTLAALVICLIYTAGIAMLISLLAGN